MDARRMMTRSYLPAALAILMLAAVLPVSP